MEKKYKNCKFILCIFLFFGFFLSKNIILGNSTNHESHIVTEIDLTGLQTGTDTTHKHIYEKQYNSSQHWEECFICHNKINIFNHNLEEKWNLPNVEHCYSSNFKRISCKDNCGYFQKFAREPHTDSNIYSQTYENWQHITTCKKCGQWASNEFCKKEDGSRITCNNLGKCAKCGYNYTIKRHFGYVKDNNIQCDLCGEIFATFTQSWTYNNNYSEAYMTMHLTTNKNNVAFYNNSNNYFNYSPNSGGKGLDDFKAEVINFSPKDTTIKYTYKLTEDYQSEISVNPRLYYSVDGIQSWEYFEYKSLNRDHIAPEIKSTNIIGNGTSDNFSNKATIQISARDNLSTNLLVRLLDEDNKTIIKDWSNININNNVFNYSFDLVAEAQSPKNLYLELLDNQGNVSKKTVTIQYLDAKAPTLVEYDKQTEWSKNKKVTFHANDIGSGNVQIAFNDLNDYSLADNFSGDYVKTYNFVGDVYGSITGALYLKDDIGNETTKKVTISNIDNTAPTITKVSHILDTTEPFGTLTIDEANDINTSLNKEGSGIIGYAIVHNDKGIPNKNMFTNSNEFKITENGTYYIYAIDLVGNISKPLEYNVNNIKWGNIQIHLNKYITTKDNHILDINTLKSDYKLNNQNLNFQLKVRNIESDKISTIYLSPENILNLSNLDIGTYEIVEIPHNLFSFSSFKNIKNNDTENITILNKNNSIIISVKKRFINDKIVSIDSFSEIESPQVMGVSSYKNNYILFE